MKTAALVLAHDLQESPLSIDPTGDEKEPVACALPEKGPKTWPLQLYKDRPLVAYAVEAAQAAGAEAVTVLVAPETADAVREALDETDGIEYATYNAATEKAAIEQSGFFELYGFSSYILEQAAKTCADADAEGVFILSGSQPLVDGTWLTELAEGWQQAEGTELAVTWHSGMRRLPFFIPRAWLDNFGASGLATINEKTGFRPAPHLSVFELDYSGKKLMARFAPQAAGRTFLDDLSVSALRAVRISKMQGDARAAVEKTLNDADKRLVAIADDLVARMQPADADESTALAAADELGHRCKLDFPLFNAAEFRDSLVYLDTSATAQRLGAALQAQYEFDTHANANVYRSIYKLSKAATGALGAARTQIEGFINAKPRSISFTSNSTSACNLAATAWGEGHVREGDTIVTWAAEHHSNMLPWVMLAERKDARVIVLQLDDDGRIDMDAYRKAIAAKPVIVCCAHISNTMGMVNPIAEMVAAAHEAGAKFMLDASQSLPHVPIDVQELGVDFMAFNAHKAYGPLGIGCLYAADSVRGEMTPLGAGGGTVSHVDARSYQLLPAPFRFEQGTPPISQAVGMARAFEYLDTIGMDEVAAHDAALTAHLMRGFRLIRGVTAFGDHASADGQAGLVSITLAGTDATGLVRALDKCDVAIRGGGHCAMAMSSALGIIGTGRFSFGIYNTAEDAEAAAVAVEACRQSLA